jgi:8-oxo-dGTP pyrophosphatase MutT (NUDIX family)
MAMAKSKDWKLIKRRLAYDSDFITVYEDEVKLPSGKTIPDYKVIEKSDGVIVVATDPSGDVLMIKQYRYPQKSYVLGLPCGNIDKGYSILESARKELLEETGFGSKKMEKAGFFFADPGKYTSKYYVIRAENVFSVGKQQLEDMEEISFRFATPTELKKAIMAGKWSDSSAIAALVLCGII